MPQGTVKVTNNATYMGQNQAITASIAGQRQQIAAGATYTFQDVNAGKQYLNVEVTPTIQGLGSGIETINISNDFKNYQCRITLNQNVWSIQKVSQ